MRLAGIVGAALVCLGLGALGVNGQAIRGHLIDDELLRPVTGASITVLIGDERGPQVLTRDDGSFFIALDAWGSYRLEARRIGYGTTTSQPFDVERGDTVTVDFRVLADAVLMNPIFVTARSNRGENVFYRRMENWDKGIFLTPDMIDSIAPSHPADVFRRDDMWLSWGWGASASGQQGPVPNVRTYLGTGCLSYMIDGRLYRRPRWATGSVWLDWPFDTLFGKDLVAVEIYRHIGEVPPEIRNAAREAFNGQPTAGIARLDGSSAARVQQDFIPQTCGVVNFWTQAGWE